jgi:Transmembrane secretion effector
VDATVGAQWFLVERKASPTVVALVQTASLTPTLLLALFAGALADRVDRRRLLIVVQAYAAVATAVLTALAVAGVLDAVSLLGLLFAIGCAAALTTPAWQAIQPELVPREQFRSAASLGGVAVDARGRSALPSPDYWWQRRAPRRCSRSMPCPLLQSSQHCWPGSGRLQRRQPSVSRSDSRSWAASGT